LPEIYKDAMSIVRNIYIQQKGKEKKKFVRSRSQRGCICRIEKAAAFGRGTVYEKMRNSFSPYTMGSA
jgi:hypothetical protein